MADLHGRIALVTGGGRGIGAAISVALARAGCDLAIVYRVRDQAARHTQAEVHALARRCIIRQADVSRSEEVEALPRDIEAELGPVGVLVNNAGVAHPLPLDQITVDHFDAEIAANLRSAFLVTQAFLPAMRAIRWGRIVFLSSVAAQVGGVVGPHYAASKAGLHGLAHSYASILAGEGITANVVAPALIDTDMVQNNPQPRADLIPIGRFGTTSEVAEAVVMLASNGYITGQTIAVNGGWYMT